MKLEVGKRYRTRSGDWVQITQEIARYPYCFVGINQRGFGPSYCRDGRYHVETLEHSRDIVAEWVEGITEVRQFRTPNGKLFGTREQAEAELEATRFVEDLRARGCPESVIEHLVLNYNVSKRGPQ